MASRYKVGDKVRLTRKVNINHFVPFGMSIVGKIVETRENGHREIGGIYGPRNYGIKFPDRSGVKWYAAKEFVRIRG